MPDPGAHAEEFFVGYLPTPPRLRLGLWVAVALIFLMALGLGAALAGRQRDPGPSRWDTDQEVSLTGIAELSPVPLLRVTKPAGGVEAILLVSEGKHAAGPRLAGQSGRPVTLLGHMLTRGDMKVLELSADASHGEAVLPSADQRLLGPSRLSGEIVDVKCYDGAMKPGDGKTHKGCAALCLRGGIPPVLITADGAYLLAGSDGTPLSSQDVENLLPWVGDPVMVAGDVWTFDDLRVLRIHPDSVVRR